MSHKEIIGLDIGNKRIGVARASTAARLAEPLVTIQAAGAIAQLKDLINSREVEAVVVGLPRSLDGHDTSQTTAVRNWADDAKQHIRLPFFWQDEALTSHHAAGQRAHRRHRKTKTADPGLDAEAAALILQDWLDSPQSDRLST